MAAHINRGGGSRLSDINVTPLVDVMLVLLIIFMVTAPMLEQQRSQVNVDLPNVAAAPSTVAEDAIVITVDVGRRVYINDNQVKQKDLEVKLFHLFETRARKEIFSFGSGVSAPWSFFSFSFSRAWRFFGPCRRRGPWAAANPPGGRRISRGPNHPGFRPLPLG